MTADVYWQSLWLLVSFTCSRYNIRPLWKQKEAKNPTKKKRKKSNDFVAFNRLVCVVRCCATTDICVSGSFILDCVSYWIQLYRETGELKKTPSLFRMSQQVFFPFVFWLLRVCGYSNWTFRLRHIKTISRYRRRRRRRHFRTFLTIVHICQFIFAILMGNNWFAFGQSQYFDLCLMCPLQSRSKN